MIIALLWTLAAILDLGTFFRKTISQFNRWLKKLSFVSGFVNNLASGTRWKKISSTQ
jgi:hypothetical protein